MKTVISIMTLASMLLAASQALADGDAAKGARIFNRCKACHTVEKGGHNKMGPNLYDVVGRKAGSVDGYHYSDSLKNSGIVWTADNLDKWLTNPRKFIAGNKMPFPGLRKEDDRKDVIAYLKSLEAK